IHTLHYMLSSCVFSSSLFFFFNAPAPPEIYTLSLHDALPISLRGGRLADRLPIGHLGPADVRVDLELAQQAVDDDLEVQLEIIRSEEHTSELQSRFDLVCRLLLEKKKTQEKTISGATTPENHQ